MNVVVAVAVLLVGWLVVPALCRRRYREVKRWHHPDDDELVVLRWDLFTGTLQGVWIHDPDQFYDEWL